MDTLPLTFSLRFNHPKPTYRGKYVNIIFLQRAMIECDFRLTVSEVQQLSHVFTDALAHAGHGILSSPFTAVVTQLLALC